MHELSIASAIVAEVRDSMEANGVSSVTDITVKVGRLSGVFADSLTFGWDIVRQGTPLAKAALIVEDDPVVVWCPDGGHSLTLHDMVFRCDEHGCATPEILAGKRLEIVRYSVGEAAVGEAAVGEAAVDEAALDETAVDETEAAA